MTDATEPTLVTQADREAAVAWYRANGQFFTDNIADGFEDDGSLVQAFANHRLAAGKARTPSGKHASHKTRVSVDVSSYDEICELCGATDQLGSWGALAKPCPAAEQSRASTPAVGREANTGLLERLRAAVTYQYMPMSVRKLLSEAAAALALHSPATVPLYSGAEAWDELVNKDDRTSPEEYPDMCLITRDELIAYVDAREAPPASEPASFCNKCGFSGVPQRGGYHFRPKDGEPCNYAAPPASDDVIAAKDAEIARLREALDGAKGAFLTIYAGLRGDRPTNRLNAAKGIAFEQMNALATLTERQP